MLGRRQLQHVLRVYVQHYNQRRPHRARNLRPPEASDQSASEQSRRLQVFT
ncbi:MAG: transposase [Actinomycetota bacterium]|nr:transposase [Actinomycetota bacterium]